MLSGCQRAICGSLFAQETVFGWILTGPIPTKAPKSFSTCVSYFCEIALEKSLLKFWEVENIPQQRVMSKADRQCEEIYQRTTTRDGNGRYTVSLPFKDEYSDSLTLGQSRKGAMAQYIRNESRLLKNPELKREYDLNIEEYVKLGHMIPVLPPTISEFPDHYYLPHHAVVKPDSSTTKVRVVFNASYATSNGTSLNDVLYTGPALQNDLTILILKWRFYRYVFSGDIEKMYRQILVSPSHTHFQRILFRQNPTEPIKDYELKTVTFGVNCAPYLAIRTMIQLANDVHDSYPLASHVLKNCMYVDDALAGAHDIHTAISTVRELILSLKSAGFNMRKWTSNSTTILSDLSPDDLLNDGFLDFNAHCAAKMLGIRWNAYSDQFYFSSIAFSPHTYTKREVLSQISKLFDPAGWISPVIVLAKIIMQKIWLDKVGWDEEISPESIDLWKAFQSSFSSINEIRVPRWFNFVPDHEIEFHGFSDASERAYAAVLYIRIVSPTTVYTHLVASKTKVAPIKSLSIPRLELCAATLLAELIDNLVPQFDVHRHSLHCWTDSTIVISWLAKQPCHWNTFVANRISKIIQTVDPPKWHHVSSEDNPADLASRGVYPQDLIQNDLWWRGPAWLSEFDTPWENYSNQDVQPTELEKKSSSKDYGVCISFYKWYSSTI
ncbi:uncharacterized protein LOC131802916 [Musca domestica]|uniref:Uncharacterized protein LOC131802339 n=2 Tax=Musca domestica TaxID=7370 RepID=A0ABM3UY59_MUSDO|nr:uncharacterized protein LOC131802339 [Musca domestica]XP_058979670.1 uncharacterized protein LOC131802914 [Musca domestica]XP_058979674.1 uncharacterized protein LOC131802916 [Musca domestica]